MTIPIADSYEDRRQHARRALRAAAQVHLPNAQVFEVRMFDISAGGACIIAAANPRPGTQFVLQMNLPTRPRGSVPIQTQVEVTHSIFSSGENGFKVGLRFTNLDMIAATAILQFVG